jgi:hypothetical protein
MSISISIIVFVLQQGDSPKDNGYQMVEMDGAERDPIIEAVKSGNLEALRRVLKKTGNVFDARNGEESALHCAAMHGT